MRGIFTKVISTVGVVFYLITCSSSYSFAQKSALDNAGEKLKKFNAHNAFNRGEFKTALNLYAAVLHDNNEDASLAFWVGECYFNLLDYPHALEYFNLAVKLNANSNPDLHLEMGRTLQILGETEKAIAAFEEYKQTNPGTKALKESEVDHYLGQCRTALELTAAPIKVTIENLGMSVNSEFDDKRPSITADGKKMIFTSRRPRDKDSPVDTEGDGKYFEDIYISLWDSAKKMWGEPDLVPGSINTEFHDAACSISPDGKQIFVYKNDPLENRGGDILISKISSNGRWGTPRPIGRPINTTYYEDGACLSPDGNTLYFISERKAKGAMGHSDIYMSTRTSKGGEWGEPVNLGPEINTEYDEGGVYIAPDGKTLFFCSNGHNSMGSYDIFKTVHENGKWTTPVNVGYPINTTASEKSFVLSSDGKTAYITSDRKGGLGESDIYKVDLTNYPILEKDPAKAAAAAVTPGFSILKGTVISNEGASALGAEINIFDEAGQKVGNTMSHADESGDYFITLPGNKKYTVKIELKDYKSLEESFLLPASKDGNTYTQVKHFLMYKK